MKPLLAKDLPTFLERFGNFVDGEFRHVEIISPTTINITLACQDSARGFDWITVEFEFSGVSDASLIDNSKLSHVDMEDGVTIIFENTLFTLSVKNSTFQIISSNIKYQEAQF